MTISLILNDKQISNKVGFLSTNQFRSFFVGGVIFVTITKEGHFFQKTHGWSYHKW